MNFLVESQYRNDVPENSRFAQVDPFCEANYIFKLLIRFEEDVIHDLDSIIFLFSNKVEKLKDYKSAFLKYSIDKRDYITEDWAKGLLGNLPVIDENEHSKALKIIKLIHTAKLINWQEVNRISDFINTEINDKEILIYLPTCKNILDSLINHLELEKLNVYTDYQYLSGFVSKEPIRVDLIKYLDIKKKLATVKDFSEDPHNLDYNAKDIDIITMEEIFPLWIKRLHKLKETYKKNNRNKLLLLWGMHQYFLNCSIQKLLGFGPVRYYYPATESISNIEKNIDSVFMYINRSKNVDLIHLFRELNQISSQFYFILHSEIENIAGDNKIFHLDNYEKVALPSTMEVQYALSKLFIMILKQNDILEGNFFYLKPLMEHNKLELVLELDDLDMFFSLVSKLKKFTELELRHNPQIYFELYMGLNELRNENSPAVYHIKEDETKLYLMGEEYEKRKIEESDGILYLLIICIYAKKASCCETFKVTPEEVISTFNKFRFKDKPKISTDPDDIKKLIDLRKNNSLKEKDKQTLLNISKKFYDRIRNTLSTLFKNYDRLENFYDLNFEGSRAGFTIQDGKNIVFQTEVLIESKRNNSSILDRIAHIIDPI